MILRSQLPLSVAVFLGACAASSPPPRAEPVALPLPSQTAVASATASHSPPPPAPTSGCLAPLGPVSDPHFAPKPIDPKKRTPPSGDALEDEYAEARTYFEANRWVEAAQGFRAIAFDHPDSELGIYASQLYLECLNVIGTQAKRDECYADMARDVPQIQHLYCSSAKRASNTEQCDVLDRIQIDIARLDAEHAVAAADKNPTDPTGYRVAGAKFAKLVLTHCVPKTSFARCDELAYNGATAFLAGNDRPNAEALRTIMRDPKNGMSSSPLLKKLSCRLDGPSSAACH